MSGTTRPTFMGLPERDPDALTGAQVAVMGASEASPYVPGEPSHSAGAPDALRAASMLFARQLLHHDFDLGATLFPNPHEQRSHVDIGDIPTDAGAPEANRTRIAERVRSVLAAGAVPIVLGGDDSVPIPVLQGFDQAGPICVVQVDAHVDWADVLRDNPWGYGSPMRRASEMPWVTAMVQAGIRGLGSGAAWQYDDACRWGSRIFTSHQIRRDGMVQVIEAIPEGAACVLSIDCDGIDPAVLPAVAMPTPGGLDYHEMIALVHGIAARGRLAGLILAEYVPERDDPHRLSGLTAARIAAVATGVARPPGV